MIVSSGRLDSARMHQWSLVCSSPPYTGSTFEGMSDTMALSWKQEAIYSGTDAVACFKVNTKLSVEAVSGG
jgi:hypothetical protein